MEHQRQGVTNDHNDSFLPSDKDEYLVTLEDGTIETIQWDDPRLEDEDEVLSYFDDRFEEFEE